MQVVVLKCRIFIFSPFTPWFLYVFSFITKLPIHIVIFFFFLISFRFPLPFPINAIIFLSHHLFLMQIRDIFCFQNFPDFTTSMNFCFHFSAVSFSFLHLSLFVWRLAAMTEKWIDDVMFVLSQLIQIATQTRRNSCKHQRHTRINWALVQMSNCWDSRHDYWHQSLRMTDSLRKKCRP